MLKTNFYRGPSQTDGIWCPLRAYVILHTSCRFWTRFFTLWKGSISAWLRFKSLSGFSYDSWTIRMSRYHACINPNTVIGCWYQSLFLKFRLVAEFRHFYKLMRWSESLICNNYISFYLSNKIERSPWRCLHARWRPQVCLVTA